LITIIQNGLEPVDVNGIAEFAGLEFAGLENDGLENDALE